MKTPCPADTRTHEQMVTRPHCLHPDGIDHAGTCFDYLDVQKWRDEQLRSLLSSAARDGLVSVHAVEHLLFHDVTEEVNRTVQADFRAVVEKKAANRA